MERLGESEGAGMALSGFIRYVILSVTLLYSRKSSARDGNTLGHEDFQPFLAMIRP